jgi:ferritin-like metal-binding protein YciE
MTQNDINSKYLEFLNKEYSAENLVVERITSRIEDPYSKITAKIKKHLQETKSQQNRSSRIIFKLGREPTDSKAHLPELKSPMTTMLNKIIVDTVKSVTTDNKKSFIRRMVTT